MSVTAPPRPPRPPRPSDPIEGEELEALVEALIEEARQRALRRRRIYWAFAAAAALVAAGIFAIFDRTEQSQTAAPSVALRSGFTAPPTKSMIAFLTAVPKARLRSASRGNGRSTS